MLARLPNVKLGFDQKQRHRQTKTADGFRKTDHVRMNARVLEAEECARTPAPDLNIVDDQHDLMPSRERFETAQPFVTRDLHAALRLDSFHNHGGRKLHATAWLAQEGF